MQKHRKTETDARKDGPYEKYLEKGAEQLSDAELLAVILRTGTVGEDTVSIATRVLSLPGERRQGDSGPAPCFVKGAYEYPGNRTGQGN